MNSGLKSIIPKGLAFLSIFALAMAQRTGQSWLLVGTLAGLALYFLNMGTEEK